MSVSVAGRPLQQQAALSDLARLSLAFVDGGLEWLGWAVASTSLRYDFPDETTLLSQVQIGLHGSPLALLPRLGLMASPVKLMSLGSDLPVLAKAEGGDASALLTAQVRRIFEDHQLLRQTDLMAPQVWLTELGVAQAPLLQGVEFQDRVALARLMRDPLVVAGAGAGSDAEALAKEAAAFAVHQARTPQEFCDYFRFHLALAIRLGASASGPEHRSEAATQAMRTLLPLFFGVLDCPQVTGLPSPAEVARAVRGWLSGGKPVGFSRLSEGLVQVMLNTRFQNETGSAARQLVETYLQAAQALLGEVAPNDGQLGQDGSSCVFFLASGGRHMELQVSANGVISLRDFGLARRSPAALVPDTDRNNDRDADRDTDFPTESDADPQEILS
jgi:hypothetical protein